MSAVANTVVLGIGNLLLADEGVGVHAARALAKTGCPKGVIVLELGTAILDALPALEHADRVIVLDAVKADGEPGTVYRMPLEDCATNPCIASMHGFDLHRVLGLMGRTRPPEVVVVGVEPARIEWSLDLSPEVARAMPTVLEAVRAELEAVGQQAGAPAFRDESHPGPHENGKVPLPEA